MCNVNHSQTVTPLVGDYSVRSATLADAESIYRVVYDYDVSLVGYSDFAKDDLLEMFREEHLRIDCDSCLVLDKEGRAVGYTMVWGRQPNRRYTASDFRRRGCVKVGLSVDASNEIRAVRVYENLGMRPERVYVTYEKLYRR